MLAALGLLLHGGAARAVKLTISSATVDQPGAPANVCVSLTTDGQEVAGTQNDLVWDGTCMTLNEGGCYAAGNHGKQVNSRVQNSADFRMRVLVLSLSDVDPIDDGVLYCCNVQGEAPAGSCCSISVVNTGASDSKGNAIGGVGGNSGRLCTQGGGGRSGGGAVGAVTGAGGQMGMGRGNGLAGTDSMGTGNAGGSVGGAGAQAPAANQVLAGGGAAAPAAPAAPVAQPAAPVIPVAPGAVAPAPTAIAAPTRAAAEAAAPVVPVAPAVPAPALAPAAPPTAAAPTAAAPTAAAPTAAAPTEAAPTAAPPTAVPATRAPPSTPTAPRATPTGARGWFGCQISDSTSAAPALAVYLLLAALAGVRRRRVPRR